MKTKTSKRNIVEGDATIYCHRVSWWFDLNKHAPGSHPLLEGQLMLEAEERAAQMIREEYHSGELCHVVHFDNDTEETFWGWWKIERD
jgi:hypothetical protein